MISIAGIRMVRNFGWVEDPLDVRDAPFSWSPLSTAPTTDTQLIDNAQYFKEVSNQFSLPACVANACADMMEAATVLDKVQKGMVLDVARSSTPDLSRMFVWWNARNEMDPSQVNNPNAGTYNRLAMDVLARFGVPTEARWPYDPLKATTRPSIMSYREAFPNRFDAFYSIDMDGDSRLRAIVQALNAKHNVLFGTALANSFMSYSGGSVMHHPGTFDSIIGRHAMVICGWNPAWQAFKIRNSWGQLWGEQGYGWIHADYVTWPGTKSLWVATKGAL
jgi:C1A family cysteine protease